MKDYWKIVNDIQMATSADKLRTLCNNAEKLIREDTHISNEDFDELMQAISYLYRNAEDFVD